MAARLSAKHGENASPRKCSPGLLQGLVRRAGRIDLGPFDRAEIIGLLLARDLGIGIRGVAAADADSRNSRRKVGHEEQTAETSAASCRNCRTLFGGREDGIDDYGMTGRDDALCLAGERGV